MYQCVLFPNFASLLFPLLVTSPCVLVGHFVTLIVFLHERVHASGFLNYVSRRLPVPSRLNIPLWRQYLHDYHDPGFVTF